MREIVRLTRDAGASVIFVGLRDNPKMAWATRRGEQLIEQEKWLAAERLLRNVLEYEKEVYVIPLRRLLNCVYRATGRLDEIRSTIPIALNEWVSTDGYTPVTLADPYLDVLDALSQELDVPLVVPRSELTGDREIYIDYIHLDATGHELLARQLATAVSSQAPFDAIISSRASSE
jgi:lysophospholipase L1-like esterase